MKLTQRLCALLVVLCLFCATAAPARAAYDEQQAQAEKLCELGLFRGGSYSFELERTPTRLEALIMLIRLVGAEQAAVDCAEPNPFDDELGWAAAAPYLAYAYAQSITQGVSETHFGANDPATARHYLTFVLRALGYDDAAGDFSYQQAELKAAELGLIPADAYTEGASFLRRDAVAVAYAALSCPLKDSEQTLLDRLRAQGAVPAEADLALAPQPEPAEAAVVRYETVPILMYHMVADTDRSNVLYLSPAHFEQHLQYFAANGIHTVTLAQLLDHWDNGTPLPEKPLVLTFDDGYQSMYTEVYPRLQAYDMTATFFVFTDFINAGGGLTGPMVREMCGGGMEIASHTVSHQILTTLSAARQQEELSESRRMLQELTGEKVLTLCYPVGGHNAQVRATAAQTGYLGAVTTEYGLATSSQDRFALPRIRINQGDGADALRCKLAWYGY